MRSINLSTVNLNLLLSLEALLEHRSVTLAARSTGVTQPAMSRSLGQLRAHFDDALLVRVGHQMVPTPLAEELARKLAPVLDGAAQLLASSSFEPSQAVGEVRIMANDHTALLFFPALAASLRRLAPGLDLRVVPPGPEPDRFLSEGHADLWLGYSMKLSPGLSCEVLGHERFIGVAWRQHPALSDEGEVTLDDYCRYPHALISVRGHGRGLVDRVLADIERKRRVGLSIPYFTLAPRVLVGTDLLLTAPEATAAAYDEPDLARFALPVAMPTFSIGVIWHERLDGDPCNRWLRELVRGSVSAHLLSHDAATTV